MHCIRDVVDELREELGPWWPAKVLLGVLALGWLYIDVVLFLAMGAV